MTESSMKLPLLLATLLLSVSPAGALPTRLLCHENDGVAIIEANELMEYFGKEKIERPICEPEDYFNDDCATRNIYRDDDPYTIEFNPETQEAVVDRDSDTIFYAIEETKDQIRLIRKRRPIDESTYQSTGYQSFYAYSILIEKDSLSSVYTEIVDRTDWGTADEGGILYTTIINGSCKDHPL